MPVMSEAGLIGLVTSTSDHFCVVNILLNIDFRVSAKVQRSRVDGIVAWDGKNLTLKNIPKMRDIKPGDVIATSEYSSTYPPDVRIGLVNEVHEQASSLFKLITLTPGVDFVKLEEVFVVNYSPEKERTELEQKPSQRPGK
jgi:rod shape-determining protein MreC